MILSTIVIKLVFGRGIVSDEKLISGRRWEPSSRSLHTCCQRLSEIEGPRNEPHPRVGGSLSRQPQRLVTNHQHRPGSVKQYTIPKRKGGVRVIAQPSREVKALQRYILDHKLSTLPIHPAATGYKVRISYRTPYIIKTTASFSN
jgi:hypothetical protein